MYLHRTPSSPVLDVAAEESLNPFDFRYEDIGHPANGIVGICADDHSSGLTRRKGKSLIQLYEIPDLQLTDAVALRTIHAFDGNEFDYSGLAPTL
jgi:hypothetical protein